MRETSSALGALIVLVTGAVPSVQAQVRKFSKDTDLTPRALNTFRFCVQEAKTNTDTDILSEESVEPVAHVIYRNLHPKHRTLDYPDALCGR